MRKVLTILAAVSLAGVTIPWQQAASQGTTSAFDGLNQADPVGSAAREVMRLVHEKCGTAGRKLAVGVASLPIEYQAFTRDQGNHIMNQVHAAFSRLPDVNMIPFRDVGAIEELRSIGMTASPNAGDAERLISQSDIIVRATGQKVGRNINFQLTATGRKQLECIVSTPVVELPPSLVGEVYVPAEKIFDAAALEFWRRSRGVNQIAVEAQSSSGATLDTHLPGHFTRQMSMAVSRMEEHATQSLGTKTELVVVPRREASLDKAQRWDADVVVEPRANGYRLMIEAKRPNTTAINQYGLIMADELPTLRRSDLIRQASMIRAPAPRPPQAGPSNVARVVRTEGDAAVISVAAQPTRIQDSVDDQSGEQRYAFQLFRESFVEFDVVKLGARQISFKPELFGSNGMQVDSFPPGRARINLRRYRLPPGQYELRVSSEERGKHEFVLASRAVSSSSMLEFEPAGRLTRRFQDWYAGERQIDRTRTCYAYTQAVEVTPSGWREQRPYIWIVINGDPKVQEIGHFIDDASRYDGKTGITAQFEDQNGSLRPLNVKALGGTVQPAATNARGELILDRESVRGYTQGASILLEGRTADGTPAKVRYSLVGYRSAINAAALNCGRPDLAQDLVWRR
jgi:hypothetical protein